MYVTYAAVNTRQRDLLFAKYSNFSRRNNSEDAHKGGVHSGSYITAGLRPRVVGFSGERQEHYTTAGQ